ncbi:Eukaryotic translation initiation factor 2B, subunit 4 delta, 67kDa [Quaeritorhiza haematococci]|nr:Eukaryotic translation initiation factor 2B, subunit 4 delta, 67kDa [Quaeritorhiza haematococci]
MTNEQQQGQGGAGSRSGGKGGGAAKENVSGKNAKNQADGGSSVNAGADQQQRQQQNQNQNPAKKSQKQMTKAERRELQERQRAEKAARAAQGGAGKTGAGAKQKSGGSGAGPSSSVSGSTLSINAVNQSASGASGAAGGANASSQEARRAPPSKSVSLFSHLTQHERESNQLLEAKAQGLIHPAVLSLGLKFSQFVITGGNARCIAMLTVFKKVISDYVTPPGITLQRHLTTYLGKQIDFLNTTRALCASMKTAIRYLKYEISILSIDMPDEDAKEHLRNQIDSFIQERIVLADRAMLGFAETKFKDGDVILTYSSSSTVLNVLLACHAKGIKFKVFVADSRPKFEGREMLKRLSAANIPCTYIMLNSVGVVMKEVTKVVLGASAVLANGAVMSRVGTAMVAMMAHDAKVPVIVCCETYKFSDAVRLDSFVWNEIGDPDELVETQTPKSTSSSILPLTSSSTFNKSSSSSNNSILKDWRQIPDLKLLNLHYDITPSQFVTMVICEIGTIPSTSVPMIMRDVYQYGSKGQPLL